MTESMGNNDAAKVYVMDGKPLKSILKKPREPHCADGNRHLGSNQVAESVVYNRNFPCLGINRSKTDGKVKDVAGKPFQVRRKVAMTHDDANTIWEVTKTDFASPLKSVWVDEPATCDAFPHEVSKLANGVDTCTQIKDNLENVNPSSDRVHVVIAHNEVNGDAIPEYGRVNFCSLLNEEKVESYDCVLPQDVADVVKSRIENTLVAYENDDGVSMFKFASKEGLEKVLQRGPWMIRKSPIILTKWSSKLSLKKGEVTCVPVWVKLHVLCGKASWGRISFARALIEVNSKSELKTKVTMAIPNEKGDGYTKEVIRVEYEWKPPHCGDCKIFEHDIFQCPKHVAKTVPNEPSKVATEVTKSDGFTEVKRKKHKGKKKTGTIRRGADMDSTTKVGANSINKVKGPSTSNSFAALNTMNVEDECGTSSSRGNLEEEQVEGTKVSQLNEHVESDDEVDEIIFPKGDKFGDKFDIRLKGRARK
ncbi:hypothetical protein Tco_0575561 [Tanacetum coccineum]